MLPKISMKKLKGSRQSTYSRHLQKLAQQHIVELPNWAKKTFLARGKSERGRVLFGVMERDFCSSEIT